MPTIPPFLSLLSCHLILGCCRPEFDCDGGCIRLTTCSDIIVFSPLFALDSLQVGQGGPGLGLGSAPSGSSHGAPASAPPFHSTSTAGRRGAGVARASDAGARATPVSSSRRVSFLLTPEQERRVCTGGSLVDSGSGSDTVPSSPRVVVTRLARQPAGATKASETYVGLGYFGGGSPQRGFFYDELLVWR